MKTTRLIFFCFCFFPFIVNSQSFTDSLSVKETLQPRVILKWAPLSLLDIYSAVQFALEYRIGGKSTVQAEAGYIFPINIRESNVRDHYTNMQGCRLRAEYRYYLHKIDRIGGFYAAPEFFFINIKFDEADVVRMPINTFGDFYYQEKSYDLDKTVFGYHLKAGYQDFITDWLLIDFYAGVGARHVNVESTEPFEEREYTNIFFYTANERGKVQRVSLSYGLKLGILLK